jgi:hypothetical protein
VLAFLSPCKYDGVRLFLPGFPFITLIAALGIYYFAKSPLRMAAVACALAASVAFAVHEYRQYQECYLNEAVALGGWSPYFETESGVIGYPELAPWLKAHPKAKIHIGMATSEMHRKEFDYDYIILPSQLGAFKTNGWYYYLHKTPVAAIKEANGLQIVGIYSTRDEPK